MVAAGCLDPSQHGSSSAHCADGGPRIAQAIVADPAERKDDMLHRRHRLAARFLAISLLAATLYAVDSLASPSPAEARCMGQGNPVYSWFRNTRPAIQVSETPAAGTCDGNNVYTGVLKDEEQDGWCAGVRFRETGFQFVTVAVVCGAGNTERFEWRDLHLNNSRAYQQLCIHRESNQQQFVCGWGNDPDAYATNWGY
jgi:hypothetical protein